MESKPKPIATVKSPSKKSHIRKGVGFSLSEIKEAGKDITQIKRLNIKIDYMRKSSYPENVKKLKELKKPKRESKKREPFVKKQKMRTPFKPEKEKLKVAPKKAVKKAPKKPAAKPKPKLKKEKTKPTKIEEVKIEPSGTPLTELSGLGTATAKKFIDIGVNNIEELCKEDPDEIAALIKGVSIDRLKKWIEEGKDLIK
ncbi:MAG: helix-hairpin-helix domain-containing protein [Candidatus Thorarchaeota archaeon]